MDDDFYKKVLIIAKAKYDLNEDVIEEFIEIIEKCEDNNFSPTRTVEYISNIIF